ncbi:ABC transporter ATP-binding protein, partial [Vibrio diabolicus]|uniref:ABC transporter ATP-binding protein n=2 Tax=Vibrionaceae TaxID=641 RepID=UPI00211B531C|nr:ATP-binding cassette domain-containing protein [Vibrio diabolicus]
AFLDLTQLGMRFPTPQGEFVALKNVDLQIQKGEFISLIGHSGCGKSTVLNLVAGLYMPSDGGVIVDGREVDGPGPERAVVFQNHSLLPWLTVYQNVELAVKQVAKGQSKAQIKQQVEHYLDLIQMAHASDKKPDEISGGMK